MILGAKKEKQLLLTWKHLPGPKLILSKRTELDVFIPKKTPKPKPNQTNKKTKKQKQNTKHQTQNKKQTKQKSVGTKCMSIHPIIISGEWQVSP